MQVELKRPKRSLIVWAVYMMVAAKVICCVEDGNFQLFHVYTTSRLVASAAAAAFFFNVFLAC